MAGPKTYWGERVITVYGGAQVTDLVRVTIKPKDGDIGSTVSMDGKETIWGQSWTKCEVEIELRQSSKTHDVLSAALSAIKKGYGAAVLPLAVSDLNGTSMITAAAAWPRNYPEQGFTESGDQTRVWTLETDVSTQINAGGL